MMAPNDLGPVARSVCIAVLVLAWATVGLRYYVRLWMVKSFGLDDWFITFTLLAFTTQASINLTGVYYGIGKHLIDVKSLADVYKAMEYWLILAILYTVTMTLLKVSIALFLLRIASKPWHRWILYGLIGVTVVFGLFFGCFLLFECHPISNFWTLTQTNCIAETIMIKVTLVHSSIMAAGDWICALLPIALVWDVQMNKRMKTSVALILALGAFGGIATIVRIVYLSIVSTSKDILFVTGNVVIWSIIEPGVGIVAVCLATLRPLFRAAFEKTIGISHRYGTSRSGSRSRSRRSRRLDNSENLKDWPLPKDGPMQLTRLESRSTHSDSSGIAFGSVPKEFAITTTVKGVVNKEKTKHECVLTKAQKSFMSRDDERPILPIIYKTSEFGAQTDSRHDMV